MRVKEGKWGGTTVAKGLLKSQRETYYYRSLLIYEMKLCTALLKWQESETR